MENNEEKESAFAFERLPVDRERTVNDKELLTFTNLTNLKWEFIDVFSGNDDEKKRSTRLSEVLKDPERFVRGYRDPVKKEDPIYVYGTDINGNYHGKETGLKELRQEAGIAMEYLEKDEGEFLKNWEVVYAADNYKLVTDYMDYLEVYLHYFVLDDDLKVIDYNNYLTLNGIFV